MKYLDGFGLIGLVTGNKEDTLQHGWAQPSKHAIDWYSNSSTAQFKLIQSATTDIIYNYKSFHIIVIYYLLAIELKAWILSIPGMLLLPARTPHEVTFARDAQAPGMEATTFTFLGEMVTSHWLGVVWA